MSQVSFLPRFRLNLLRPEIGPKNCQKWPFLATFGLRTNVAPQRLNLETWFWYQMIGNKCLQNGFSPILVKPPRTGNRAKKLPKMVIFGHFYDVTLRISRLTCRRKLKFCMWVTHIKEVWHGQKIFSGTTHTESSGPKTSFLGRRGGSK